MGSTKLSPDSFFFEIYKMANPTTNLIEGLRKAAENLRLGAFYAWGHHGACNCGHLLQATTRLSKEEILSYAHTGAGEWTEIAEESCSISGAPVSLLLTKLAQLGLTPTDIHNIEYLQDREVLNQLPGGFRWLKRNVREDVICYFETFAMLLEEKMIQQIPLSLDQFFSQQTEKGKKQELMPVG
jgi:hypothetical protein